jgi:hypothetical protein
MLEYQIQPNTRRCVASGRELRPGEKVFSVLLDQGGKLVRQDYSAEAWQGPPPGAFSFWTGRVPSGEASRRPQMDDELVLDCFHRLEHENDAGRVNFRYVLALLLMRRKRLRFEDARTHNGQEVLCLRCPRSGHRYEVVHPQLSDEEMTAVQEEVGKVLGWE